MTHNLKYSCDVHEHEHLSSYEHLLTILYADQQSINKVPKIWGQLNEKGNGSSPDPFLARLRRALRKKVWLARLALPCQRIVNKRL